MVCFTSPLSSFLPSSHIRPTHIAHNLCHTHLYPTFFTWMGSSFPLLDLHFFQKFLNELLKESLQEPWKYTTLRKQHCSYFTNLQNGQNLLCLANLDIFRSTFDKYWYTALMLVILYEQGCESAGLEWSLFLLFQWPLLFLSFAVLYLKRYQFWYFKLMMPIGRQRCWCTPADDVEGIGSLFVTGGTDMFASIPDVGKVEACRNNRCTHINYKCTIQNFHTLKNN